MKSFHQALVYDLECVLLLIGCISRNIIEGMLIIFDDAINDAHKIILKIAYRHGLKWVHDHLKTPLEYVQWILGSTSIQMCDSKNIFRT